MNEAKTKAKEAKAFLQQIHKADRMIDRKLASKDALYSQMTRITPVLRDVAVQGGGNHDRIGEAEAKMIDLEREITRDIDRLTDIRRDVERLLDRVADKNVRHFEILQRRYISYQSFPDIASAMGYDSIRGVTSLHGRALLTFWNVMHEKKDG